MSKNLQHLVPRGVVVNFKQILYLKTKHMYDSSNDENVKDVTLE